MICRPRRPERTALYQILEREFDRYVGVYEERFEHRYGPFRATIQPAVEEYLACDRLRGGFARVRCPSCHGELLLAFIQTFGSYVNFNPHIHALVSDS